MSVGRYALGVAALVCVAGSLGAGATALRAALVPQWRGTPARLGDVVAGLFLLVLTAQLLGTVGLLRLAPLVLASVAVGIGLRLWLGPARAEPGRDAGGPRSLSRMLILVAPVLAAGVVLTEWAGPTLQSYGQGILGADSVSYHLPWAASFAQTGQITSIRYTDIQYLTGFYPATSELLHGIGIVLMGSDVLSPALNFIWLALVLLAAWCVGDARGVGSASLLAGALVMGTPMLFFSTAGSADNDAAAVFFLLAAVALWLRASDGAKGPLFLSALAAGLAVSVKLNLLAPVALMTAAVVWAAPRGRRRAGGGAWIAGVLLAGGFWYVRNLIAVGNPLPYFSFGVLPTPQPAPLQQSTNYAIASYLGHGRILRDVFGPALASGLGPWWVAILACAVLGAGLCAAFGPDRLVRIAGLLALLALGAYLVTPGSASGPWGNPKGFYFNLRYGAPALLVALAVAPLAAPLARRFVRWFVVCGLAAMFVATVAQARLWSPGYTIRGDVATTLLALALGAAAMLVPWSRTRAASALVRVGASTAILTLLLAGAAAGYGANRHYLQVRYTKEPGLKPVARLWRWARTVRGRRIAFGGTFGWYFGYPVLRDRGLQPRRLPRPSGRARVVHRDRELPGVAPGDQRRPLQLRRDLRLARDVDGRGHALTGDSLDPRRPGGGADQPAAHRELGARDLRRHGPAQPRRLPVALLRAGARLRAFDLAVFRWRGRLELTEQLGRDLGDAGDGALEGLLVGARGLVEAADLAHVLERGGLDLLVGCSRLEVVESPDVSAHALSVYEGARRPREQKLARWSMIRCKASPQCRLFDRPRSRRRRWSAR